VGALHMSEDVVREVLHMPEDTSCIYQQTLWSLEDIVFTVEDDAVVVIVDEVSCKIFYITIRQRSVDRESLGDSMRQRRTQLKLDVSLTEYHLGN